MTTIGADYRGAIDAMVTMALTGEYVLIGRKPWASVVEILTGFAYLAPSGARA